MTTTAEEINNFLDNTFTKCKDGKAVAKKLHKLKVKGNPKCSDTCPLAVLLNQEFPGENICVSLCYVNFGDHQFTTLENNLQDFVLEFDSGKYQELCRGYEE